MSNALLNFIEEHDLTDRIFSSRQLSNIVGGSDLQRYRLVSKAIKDGVIVRLKRGLYCLSPSYSNSKYLPDPNVVAKAIDSTSYVSFETALRFHNWIPEAVYITTSTTQKSKKVRFRHEVLGWFTYQPLSVNKQFFFEGVSRYTYGKQVAFLADPLRALMDIVERSKQPWTGIDYIEEGLRVEDEDFLQLNSEEFAKLKKVYKRDSTKNFLRKFENAVYKRKFNTGSI